MKDLQNFWLLQRFWRMQEQSHRLLRLARNDRLECHCEDLKDPKQSHPQAMLWFGSHETQVIEIT